MLLTGLQHALKCIELRRVDVVVVVPSSQLDGALRSLVALAGDEGVMGGKCLRTPHGLLTVAAVNEPTPEARYDVMFQGWGSAQVGAEEMDRWRKAARQVLIRMG